MIEDLRKQIRKVLYEELRNPNSILLESPLERIFADIRETKNKTTKSAVVISETTVAQKPVVKKISLEEHVTKEQLKSIVLNSVNQNPK